MDNSFNENYDTFNILSDSKSNHLLESRSFEQFAQSNDVRIFENPKFILENFDKYFQFYYMSEASMIYKDSLKKELSENYQTKEHFDDNYCNSENSDTKIFQIDVFIKKLLQDLSKILRSEDGVDLQVLNFQIASEYVLKILFENSKIKKNKVWKDQDKIDCTWSLGKPYEIAKKVYVTLRKKLLQNQNLKKRVFDWIRSLEEKDIVCYHLLKKCLDKSKLYDIPLLLYMISAHDLSKIPSVLRSFFSKYIQKKHTHRENMPIKYQKISLGPAVKPILKKSRIWRK